LANNCSNLGMLKLDFFIDNPLRTEIQNFFYSIYGNSGYILKGAFDIRQLENGILPSLLLKTNANTIFFIKMKTIINNIEIENCKFLDITKLKNNENINMNILDKSTEELFKSINLEDSDSEDGDGGSHVSDCISESNTCSASNSDTDLLDESNTGMITVDLN